MSDSPIQFDPDDDVPDPNGVDQLKPKSKPFCNVHFCRMESIRSSPLHTHYRCVVKGCKNKRAVMRAEYEIPKEPQPCPKCSKGDEQVFCEVDEMLTFNIRLKCPNCSFHLDVPRPDIENQIRKWNRSKRIG